MKKLFVASLCLVMVFVVTMTVHAQNQQFPNAPCDSISWANVKCYGATGNGSTDDTAAFTQALSLGRHVYVPEGTYVVGPLTLTNGAWITGAGTKLTTLAPKTSSQNEVFYIDGSGMSSMTGPVHIEDLTIYPNTTMQPGTAGIRIDYGNEIYMNEIEVGAFDDNIYIDNSQYIYLTKSTTWGASHSNLYALHSDSNHGAYYGGPLYADHTTFDSTSTAVAGILVTDWASVHISHCDITGNLGGRGVDIEQTVSPTDEPSDIQIVNNTIDSNGQEGIYLDSIRNSQVSSNWVSGGRSGSYDGIKAVNTESLAITANQLFWNGNNGLSCDGCNYSTITGNVAEGNRYAGIAIAQSTYATVTANVLWNNPNRPGGYTQQYGIIDYGNSSYDSFIGNKANTNSILNYWFAGSYETVYQ
jgi:parallel beta-helix repeat protein